LHGPIFDILKYEKIAAMAQRLTKKSHDNNCGYPVSFTNHFDFAD
jgi:hypothetical protein